MHFNALRSLTQPCMTAYCIRRNTYDPGISPGSANQCILWDVYLRSNLSRKDNNLSSEPTTKKKTDSLTVCTSVPGKTRLSQAALICHNLQNRLVSMQQTNKGFYALGMLAGDLCLVLVERTISTVNDRSAF